MKKITPVRTAEDWRAFIDVFNRCTIYAPYTVPLTMDMVNDHIIPFMNQNETFAALESDGEKAGIIHAGKDNNALGYIYLLFADSNDIACSLLKETEEWFRRKRIKKITFRSIPYKYILHGAESYVWGGAYAAINAFRRFDYDLCSDIIVMACALEKIKPSAGATPGLELNEVETLDNDLAWAGRVTACIGGEPAGHCSFFHLKALSRKLKKGFGQIGIRLAEHLHGSDIAEVMFSYAHGRLHERGVRVVILATNQRLFRAVKFYEKMGYRAEVIKGYGYSKELR